MKIPDHGHLAVLLDRVHLSQHESLAGATVRITVGSHRDEAFLPAVKDRAQSLPMPSPAASSAEQRSSSSSSTSRARSKSRSRSASTQRSRSSSRLRESATVARVTTDPEAVQELAKLTTAAAATSASTLADPVTASPTKIDLPIRKSDDDLFAAWRSSVMRQTGGSGASVLMSSPGSESAKGSMLVGTPGSLRSGNPDEGYFDKDGFDEQIDMSMAEVAAALGEIDDGGSDVDADGDDDDEDDGDSFDQSSFHSTVVEGDVVHVHDVPTGGTLLHPLVDPLTVPLNLHSFLYDSAKLSVIGKAGKVLAKCKLRIKQIADPGDADHEMSAALASQHTFHLIKPGSKTIQPILVGSVQVRMCAQWGVTPPLPDKQQQRNSKVLQRANTEPILPSSTPTGYASTPKSPLLPHLARSLSRNSVALSIDSMPPMPSPSIRSSSFSMSLSGTNGTATPTPGGMPGTPTLEQMPIDLRASYSPPSTSTPSTPTWPQSPRKAYTESFSSSRAGSIYSFTSDETSSTTRHEPEFTKIQALREMVRLGKAFFGEGWKGMPMRDLVGAMLLLRKWANHPARQLARPRQPLHQLCPDVGKLKYLQRHFKYALACYGQIGLNFFGYGRGYVVDTVASSDKDMAIKLLGIKEEQILTWDMSRTGATAAPHSFSVWVPEEETVVLCIRGTMNLEDTLTDLLAIMEPFLGGVTHAGFKRCAEYVYERQLPDLRSALALYRPKRLLITGHSLGGAVATLVAMLLRTRDASDLRFLACGTDPNPDAFRIECLTYASPPCVNQELAAQFPDFVGVVNDTDVVPRLSYAAVMDLKHMLVAASDQIKESTRTSGFAAKVGARFGLFKESSLSSQFAALDRARVQLGGITPVADSNATVRLAKIIRDRDALIAKYGPGRAGKEGPIGMPKAADAGWSAKRMDAGPQLHVKLTHPGTVYYLMRSEAATTKSSPDPVTGKMRTRTRAKPHVEAWVAPNEYESEYGAAPKGALLDLTVAPQALLNHVPDAYDRALVRAVHWAERCALAKARGDGDAEPAADDVVPLSIASHAGPVPPESRPVTAAVSAVSAPPARASSKDEPPSPGAVEALNRVGEV
ncbi:hypothetical protein BCR44DRAFT_24819 [Catenaria anguillulae PL171]|uniref:Fungal lipase-type domain-containing protein n=1 Tax=Catenaria anguillulae PL171 TaxID=765915 RepID=A0A1Y2HRV6_9FUNG|nr:hypothetical protein BCR44DRAFT_24819 [Catenaria anguillulae PL171]